MNRDLFAGGFLVLAGGAYALYAVQTLPLGTVRQMGAGLFPAALGVLLATFGACIAIAGLLRSEAMPSFKPRAVTAVMVSILLFALLIRTAGLAPAVIATAICAAVALPGQRPMTVAALCAVLVFLTWAIFILLLDQPISVIRLPF